jgi:hypothetical protein
VAVIIVEKGGAIRLESIRGGLASAAEKIGEKISETMAKRKEEKKEG